MLVKAMPATRAAVRDRAEAEKVRAAEVVAGELDRVRAMDVVARAGVVVNFRQLYIWRCKKCLDLMEQDH